MEPTTKQRTRKSMKGIKSVFVLSSLAIAMTPTMQVINVPARSFGDHDFLMSTYMRPTGSERQRASKMRERQLFREIRAIRKQIRVDAQVYVMERERIIDPTPKEQGIINRSSRLINQIFNENINGGERKAQYDNIA